MRDNIGETPCSSKYTLFFWMATLSFGGILFGFSNPDLKSCFFHSHSHLEFITKRSGDTNEIGWGYYTRKCKPSAFFQIRIPIRSPNRIPIRIQISIPIRIQISIPIRIQISLPIRIQISILIRIQISIPIRIPIRSCQNSYQILSEFQSEFQSELQSEFQSEFQSELQSEFQ